MSFDQVLQTVDSRRVGGFVLALAGTALFSMKPVLIKLAFAEGASAETVMALRMGFSLPFYLIVGVIAVRMRPRNVSGRDVLHAAAIGILGYYVASYLDLLGLELISAQLERLILFSYPTFVVIVTAIIAGRWVDWRTIVALLLTYAGLLLLFGRDVGVDGPGTVRGSLLVLCASAVFAAYVMLSKPVIARLGSRLFTCIAMVAASAAISLHVGFSQGFGSVETTSMALTLIFVIAVFATVLPSFMISEAIARIGPPPTSIIGSIGPMATSVAAVFVLGEAFTHFHVGGLGLAVAGVLLLTTSREAG